VFPPENLFSRCRLFLALLSPKFPHPGDKKPEPPI
jgi:hypothetical protein